VTEFKCGSVALIGRPNAGKSTLLNRMLGTKLAITSAKAQTTRHRIAGILTTEGMQAILLDSPGIHEAWTELNKQMVGRALAVLDEADTICWVCDMTDMAKRVEQGLDLLCPEEARIADAIRKRDKPTIFVANKIDVVPLPLLLPILDGITKALPLAAAIPLSALTGDGMERLLAELASALPEGPMLYPEDEWAQVTERFLVEETIREKVFHLTSKEIPYSTCVEVRSFDESERDTNNIVRIHADVIVERASQKGIVIGKGAEMLKRIGTLARRELQDSLGCRVHLQLHVKVEKDWSRSEKGLRKVGFTRK
jgi:GTPase